MSLLEVCNLTKCYAKKTAAVENLTLSVQQGQIFGFLGPNGSGKTTTLGMIFGVITPTHGTISVFGGTNRQALRQGRMSGTLEQPNLYPYLTGRENLKVVAAIKGLDAKFIQPALATVDMLEVAGRTVKSYSLGMKQRLALAAAILGEPELLLLDEPTNGLDPEGMREVRDLLIKLSASGRTILISTHLLDEVEKVCTHVAVMNKGRLQRSGPVGEFTGATAIYRLSAANVSELRDAVGQYELARNIRVVGEVLYAELRSGTPALLNRYLAERGIYLNELCHQRQTMEQAFLTLTASESDVTGQGV